MGTRRALDDRPRSLTRSAAPRSGTPRWCSSPSSTRRAAARRSSAASACLDGSGPAASRRGSRTSCTTRTSPARTLPLAKASTPRLVFRSCCAARCSASWSSSAARSANPMPTCSPCSRRSVTRSACSAIDCRAQEERDRFFTLSLDMLCIVGFDGSLKRVNPAWHRILGYDEADLLSRQYLDFVHPDDREATLAEAAKLTEGKEVLYFENRYWHKDGTLRWLLWAAAPFPEQQLAYAAGTGHHRAQSRRRDDGARCPRTPGGAPRARRSGVAAGATRQGAGSVEAARRGCRRNEERVSREHEPRDPDAAQRHPRDDDARAPDPALRPNSRIT